MKTAVADTSIDAFHAHKANGRAMEQQKRIVAFIEKRGGDWSIGELAHALGLEKSTVSARVNELLYKTGDLAECAKRKDRISGVKVRPVGLPVGQGKLFQ